MKKLIKLVNILLAIALIFIAIGVIYIAFPQFGNRALIVRSGSMTPNIPVGAIVVARPLTPERSDGGQARPTGTYSIGDVITFKSEKSDKTMITHRITSVENDKSGLIYKTKGDANEEEDAWVVKPEKVVGKVNFTLPYAGQFLTFVKSREGFFVMIVIPAIFVMFLETWNIISELRKRRKIASVNKPFEGFGFNTTAITSSNNKDGPLSRTNQGPSLVLKLLIPFILIISIAVPGTYALLSDDELSTDNVFQAASFFPTPSAPPSITPSISPSVTPTPSQGQANIYVSNDYTCPAGASVTTENRGTVSFNKDSSLDVTDVTVVLSGALPNATYELWVNQDPGGCPLGSPTDATFITTDGSGDGNNTLNNHALVGGAVNFWVSLVSGGDVLRSTAVGL